MNNTLRILIFIVNSIFVLASSDSTRIEQNAEVENLSTILIQYDSTFYGNFSIIKNCDGNSHRIQYFNDFEKSNFESYITERDLMQTPIIFYRNMVLKNAKDILKELKDFVNKSKDKSCKTETKVFRYEEIFNWISMPDTYIERMSSKELKNALKITLLQFILTLYSNVEMIYSCVNKPFGKGLEHYNDQLDKITELYFPKSTNNDTKNQKDNLKAAFNYLSSLSSNIHDFNSESCKTSKNLDLFGKNLKSKLEALKKKLNDEDLLSESPVSTTVAIDVGSSLNVTLNKRSDDFFSRLPISKGVTIGAGSISIVGIIIYCLNNLKKNK
ncbi:uncharacterized protein LOC122501884 isoform X2 [Leptopilina heterotoma]|uniref:uncharacterized protein LOC122501884 isoform X2 n=1 Tax=Leptopilina heterotoma TaxID=63436 RepID=UPI001CA867EF|nr:uncharacterized protein LOC122501884 isoform X2 [Leptopilina heterotoma]